MLNNGLCNLLKPWRNRAQGNQRAKQQHQTNDWAGYRWQEHLACKFAKDLKD
jgi:hypothetical protein